MKFTYKAYDSGGQGVLDTVEAPSLAEAMEVLRAQGVYITEINPLQDVVNAARAHRRGGGSLRQVADFSRQLFVLVSAGTPVVQSVIALERQIKDPRWRAVIADVRLRVEEGSTLAEAMGAHPDAFDAVTRSLIAAGESSGQLEQMLDRVATLARKRLSSLKTISKAMMYPALMISVSSVVVAVLVTLVLPRFAGMFETLGADLPPTTAAMMALSDLVRGWWWAVLLVLAGSVAGVWQYLRTPAGQRAMDTAMISLPIVGPITRSLQTARIVRLFGVLTEGRVPLLEALALTRQSVSNYHYVELVAAAEQAATDGERISSAFENNDLVSPEVVMAIRNGEESGRLGNVLTSISDHLDEENDVTLRSLTTLLEPVILIVMGLVIGFMAVSMFLPLFDLTASTGGAS